MTTFQVTWKTSIMTELLQFQAHYWHPIMQKKFGKSRKPFSKNESVLVGDTISENCFKIHGKYANVRTNFGSL